MLTRRTFAASALAAGIAAAQTPKLKLGLIGAGWYGMVDLRAAYKAGGIECAAISDLDTEHLKVAADECEKTQGSRPKEIKDYRELIDLPGLDALIIATPPHWHALPFIAACRKGLPVYMEKPLAYDIREGRAMVNAWKKAGNIVQVGFQRRQPNGFRRAAEMIRSGAAGRIVQVDAQIHYNPNVTEESTRIQDPPSSLDWETWCGPAPKLPYRQSIGHKTWRLEKEYGHGHLVDWGIHLIDATRVILEESTPKSVTAVGGIYELKDRITTPDTLTVHFDFERCPVVWRHRIYGAPEYSPEVQNGVFFYGTKNTIFANDSKMVVVPAGKDAVKQTIEAPEQAETGVRHMAEFLDGVRSKKQPGCTPEDAHRSTTTVQLAMASYESGTRVEWDRDKEQITNSPAAAKLLKRAYRKPYTHPA